MSRTITRHTPGLWEALAPRNDSGHWVVGARRVLRGRPAHCIVARIDNGAPGDTLNTEEANARLIAAAPDLLDALADLALAADAAELLLQSIAPGKAASLRSRVTAAKEAIARVRERAA